MEQVSHESSLGSPEEAYEQNRALQLELLGRINARLAAKYRTERPREWEYVGMQEEVTAMLWGIAEFLDA